MLLKGVVTLLLSLSTVCGEKPARIEDKSFPFTALITVNTMETSVQKFNEAHCSGALLSDTFVITAKVCIDKFDEFRIRLGPVRNGNKTAYSYDHLISTRPYFSTQYSTVGEADQALALIYLNPKCIFTLDMQPVQYRCARNVSNWLVMSGFEVNQALEAMEPQWLQIEPIGDEMCKETIPKSISMLLCAQEADRLTMNVTTFATF